MVSASTAFWLIILSIGIFILIVLVIMLLMRKKSTEKNESSPTEKVNVIQEQKSDKFDAIRSLDDLDRIKKRIVLDRRIPEAFR